MPTTRESGPDRGPGRQRSSRQAGSPGSMSRVVVTRQVIVSSTLTLGQLLKFADVVQSGGEAKELIASGAVTVDGVVETRRGRKLVGGERVAVGRELLAVVLKER